MEQPKYLPNVVAAFLTHSRVLRIYRNKSCLLNEIVDDELGGDSDYWNTINIDDKVLDINLHEEVGYTEPSLVAYPVVNDQVDCTTWKIIKLKVMPI